MNLAEEEREKVMRHRYLIVFVAALAVLFVGLVSGQRSAQAYDGVAYDAEELRFLQLINDHRKANGDLPSLILSDAITEAADKHSEDMGVHGFFAHDTVGSSYFPAGSAPWDRMEATGYDQPNAAKAENIAVGYETAQEAFEALRNSPGHNENMLDGSHKVIGIGRVHVPDSKYGWYWTTDFGSEEDPTAHAPDAPPPEDGDSVEDGDGVENGSMDEEEESVWEQATRQEGKELVSDGVARLGGYDSARDRLSQKVRPAEGQKLVYRLRVDTKESEHPSDSLVIRITDEDGDLVAIARSASDADARRSGRPAWIEHTVDLSSFAGRSVTVSFVARTDEQHPTIFLVDDVALE